MAAAERLENHTSYVDCGAIGGGALLALALSIVFVQFGSGIGLSMTSDIPLDHENAFGRVLAVGLWVLWIQVIASLAGGYLAGRMRRPFATNPGHEREMRDGAHGLMVWAAATVAVAIGVSLMAAFATLGVDEAPQAERAADIISLEHNAGIIVTFSAAATSLIAAVASWWAATKGGEHRDEGIDHSHYVTFRKKK